MVKQDLPGWLYLDIDVRRIQISISVCAFPRIDWALLRPLDCRGFKDVSKAGIPCSNMSIYKYLVGGCCFLPKVSNVKSHVREGSGKRH